MQAQIKLGRIFGIEIGLHYSWFIIALLITLSLVGQFYATNSEWGWCHLGLGDCDGVAFLYNDCPT